MYEQYQYLHICLLHIQYISEYPTVFLVSLSSNQKNITPVNKDHTLFHSQLLKIKLPITMKSDGWFDCMVTHGFKLPLLYQIYKNNQAFSNILRKIN